MANIKKCFFFDFYVSICSHGWFHVAAMEDINLNKTDLPYVDFLICMPYLPMLRTKMVVDNDMIILFNGTIESDS